LRAVFKYSPKLRGSVGCTAISDEFHLNRALIVPYGYGHTEVIG